MKKLLLIAFSVIIFFVPGCEEEDEISNVINAEDILGVWVFDSGNDGYNITVNQTQNIKDPLSEGTGSINIGNTSLTYLDPSADEGEYYFYINNYGTYENLENMENAFDYYCNTYNSTSILYAYSYGEYVISNYSYDGIVQYEESTNTITVLDEIEMKDVLVSWGDSYYDSEGYFYFELSSPANVTIELTVDGFYEEASWNIYNYTTSSYYYSSDQTFNYDIQTITESIYLSAGSYAVICKDSYGDGGIAGSVYIVGSGGGEISGTLTGATKEFKANTPTVFVSYDLDEDDFACALTFEESGQFSDPLCDNINGLWSLDGNVLTLTTSSDEAVFEVSIDNEILTLDNEIEYCELYDYTEAECDDIYNDIEYYEGFTTGTLTELLKFTSINFNKSGVLARISTNKKSQNISDNNRLIPDLYHRYRLKSRLPAEYDMFGMEKPGRVKQ
jgi:hypothetical protein